MAWHWRAWNCSVGRAAPNDALARSLAARLWRGPHRGAEPRREGAAAREDGVEWWLKEAAVGGGAMAV